MPTTHMKQIAYTKNSGENIFKGTSWEQDRSKNPSLLLTATVTINLSLEQKWMW